MSNLPPIAADSLVQSSFTKRDPALWQLSQSLESTFLTEMLSAAGLGQTSDQFGGGIGEQQFSSFLSQQRADAMVDKGGIGLAEAIYKSLLESGDPYDAR